MTGIHYLLVAMLTGMAVGAVYGLFDIMKSVSLHNSSVEGLWDGVSTLVAWVIVLILYSFSVGFVFSVIYIVLSLLYGGFMATDILIDLF